MSCPIFEELEMDDLQMFKYVKLAKYLCRLSLEDIEDLKPDDMVAFVEPEHKILMASFIQNFLPKHK